MGLEPGKVNYRMLRTGYYSSMENMWKADPKMTNVIYKEMNDLSSELRQYERNPTTHSHNTMTKIPTGEPRVVIVNVPVPTPLLPTFDYGSISLSYELVF